METDQQTLDPFPLASPIIHPWILKRGSIWAVYELRKTLKLQCLKTRIDIQITSCGPSKEEHS